MQTTPEPSAIARIASLDRRRAITGAAAAAAIAALEVPTFARMLGADAFGPRAVGVLGLVAIVGLLGMMAHAMRGTWRHRGLDTAGLLDVMEARARGRIAVCGVLKLAIPAVVGTLLAVQLAAPGAVTSGSLVSAILLGLLTIAFGRMSVRRVAARMVAQIGWVRATRGGLGRAEA